MAAEIVLLFVGRTGNGKSSTANSLIGDKFFSTGKQCDDIKLKNKTAELEGSKITVIDGTGIGDTGADMNGDIQDTIQRAETAFQLCESGFNALIFVIAYGTRFTKQEKDAVDMIKSLFGRDIFRRFGVIAMSRGDQFEMDSEDDRKTFDQWCREQTGAIRDLFQECEYRILLFNNKSTDEKTLDSQRRSLVDLVKNNLKYSLMDFDSASIDRKHLLEAHRYIDAQAKNQKFLQHIDEELIKSDLIKDYKRRKEMLSRLNSEIEKEIKILELKFKGTDFGNLLITPLQSRAAIVKSNMRKLNQDLQVQVGKTTTSKSKLCFIL